MGTSENGDKGSSGTTTPTTVTEWPDSGFGEGALNKPSNKTIIDTIRRNSPPSKSI